MTQPLLFPAFPPAPPPPRLLTVEEQDEVVECLARGAGVQIACRSIFVNYASFFRTAEEDAGFRRRLRYVRLQLSENVASAVYQAAMKGTPAAQALWLRTFSPASYADPNPLLSNETADDLASLPTDAIDLQLHAYRTVGLAPDESSP